MTIWKSSSSLKRKGRMFWHSTAPPVKRAVGRVPVSPIIFQGSWNFL